MLEVKDLNINIMEKIIFVQLLDEGTKVYRPVPACEIENSIYKVGGFENYDPEDETWEFPPGTYVVVEEQNLEGETVLVAVKQQSPI